MVLNNFKKGQSFSAEVLVVMIILLFTSLFLVIIKINNINNVEKVQEIKKNSLEDNSKIISELKSQDILDSQNNLDINKLVKLQTIKLREKFNLKSDFAITFEKDGKLIKLDPSKNITCIGSNNIIINGNTCVQ